MVTIHDVAKEAGVSIATVSRVLNDTDYVSDEVRERVLQVAEDLHYRPSRVAQSLRSSKTQTIGVLVPQVDQPFFGKLTFAIQNALKGHDYYTLVANTMEDRTQENKYLEMLLEQRVEGVLIVPTGQSKLPFERLTSNGIPTVIIDRDISNVQTADRILCNNRQGAEDAMQHLIDLGHTHICIMGGPSYSTAVQERIKGVRRAALASESDIAFDVVDLALPEFQRGVDAALEVLRRDERPTAIFALSDIIAVSVLHAAQQIGLSVPDDLSVIGFDDIPLASYSLPALTTVAQPVEDMGRLAAEALLERIDEKRTTPATQELMLELVVRQSTAPPRG